MREKIQKYFSGTLNADDDAAFVAEDQFVNAENVRYGTTDKGVTGTIESIGSTVMLSAAEPSITFVQIGAAEDTANNRFIYFLKDLYGIWDKIMCYDISTETIYTVLRASQVTGGLGFDKNYLIHSVRVVNGLLYWTDNLNQPRRININKGIELNQPGTYSDVTAYTNPLESEVITIIRKPPYYPLEVVKSSQLVPALDNNFISGFAGKFAAFFEFYDGEKSVLGSYSELINYNTKLLDDGDYNCVDITFSFGDQIQQDVLRIWLCVQFGVDPNFFGVKIWDKNNATDAAEIAAHNAGTTALTYRFYNDQTGIALGTQFSVKPFDSVSRLSETLEVADNRLMLGNNLEGYTSPLVTSLTATLRDQTAGNTITGNVFKLVISNGQIRYVIQLPLPSNAGYYRYTADDTIPPPSPVAFSALTFISASETAVFQYYIPTWPVPPPSVSSFTFYSTQSTTGTPNALDGQQCYKSASPYRIAIFFSDQYRRRCGIVVNGEVYQTADRSFSTVAFTTSIDWVLSNANRLEEIPDWAYYYSIVRTKCLRTNFFLQARSQNSINSMTYVNRDADNQYTFTTSSYSQSLYGVAVDITNLQNFGMGYQFQQNDLIKIYKSGSSVVYTLSIIGQQGQWLICELQNLGSLDSSTSALFEIFTPYKPSINEAYYEVGATYAINNPGTDSREYSVLSGSLRGDITILDRGAPGNYYTEVMSPNDKFYKDWFTDAGQPNIIDTIGEQRKETNVSWSNTLIPGTRTNGLSSFDALDEKNLPESCGALRKLQLTSKVQNELGQVLLAICEDQTASLYIKEVQTYGSDQSAGTVNTIADVIGTVNVLKGNYGTTNPESVTEFRGSVFWLDAINGKVIQYSNNGLFPISNYKMTRFWKVFCDQYLSMSAAEIEALGGRPFIFTTVDPHHMELLLSIPKLSNTPPRGYLPDYPSTIYPFDILDFQGKTIVYKLDLGDGQPRWQGSYSFNPQGFITLQNKLFSFYQGHLHEHNQTTSYNEFYGVQYKSKVMFVANQNPNMVKVFDNIRIESNITPTLTYFYSESPYQQASDLVDFDYTNYEGFLYSTLYRNKLVPTFSGFNTNGLLTAEKMRTYVLRVMLQFTVSTIPVEIRFATIGVSQSLGHVLK